MNSPYGISMVKKLCCVILRLFGWHVEENIPLLSKYVLIGAPHTTNWDFPLTLLGLSCLGVRFHWVAKHTLFRWPLGSLLRAIGGIAVDRSSGAGFLKKAIDLFHSRDNCILAISPEGTRSRSKYWKTGFYTIAQKAGVPVVMGYIDYQKKCIGIGEAFTPSGDIEHDFKRIRLFYSNKKGKYPENQGEILIKPNRKKAGSE